MNLMSRGLFYCWLSIIFMKIVLPSFYEISTLLRATITQPVVARSGRSTVDHSETVVIFDHSFMVRFDSFL